MAEINDIPLDTPRLNYHTVGEQNRDREYDNPGRNATESELQSKVRALYKADGIANEVSLELLMRAALLAKDRKLLPIEREDPTPNAAANGHQNGTASTGAVSSPNQGTPEAMRRRPNTHGIAPVEVPTDPPPILEMSDRYTTKEERTALDHESSGSMRALTKQEIIILATCVAAAAAQGMAQESIVGANLLWPGDLGISKGQGKLVWSGNGLNLFSLVQAVPYAAAGLLGSWITDPLTYKFGRRGALCFAGVCTFVAPIGAAYSQSWYDLVGWRILQGIGIGSKSSVVPIIMAESFPHELRTRLSVFWQASVAFGIFVGSLTNAIFHDNWRNQVGICFVSAVPLLLLSFIIPESPRWLLKTKQLRKAFKSLVLLRETMLQAARDFILFYDQIEFEKMLYRRTLNPSVRDDHLGIRSFFVRLGGLRSIRRNKRAVWAVCSVMFAQQCSGINLFAFLATTIIKQSHLIDTSNMKTLGFNIGFGGANFVFSALTFWFLEARGNRQHRFGRRTLLLTSLVTMVPFLLLTGHYMDKENPSLDAVTGLVMIYTGIYSFGAGVVPFPYASEAFPQDFREVGMSLACSVNFLCAFALAIAVPQFTELEPGGGDLPRGRYMNLFGAFAGLCGFSAILVFFLMRSPEPRAKLADYNFLFDQPFSKFMEYQFRVAMPHLLFPSRSKLTFEEWDRR